MSNRFGGRWRSARARLVLGALMLPLAVPALAGDAPVPKWFGHDAAVEKIWAISGDPSDPSRVSVRRRIVEDVRGPARRILVLYPRPSSAYDIAISKILRVLATKDINVELTAIDFETDDARGMAALRFAEDNKFDLIFSMGSESTAWLYERYRGGAIPVVSVCSKDPVQLGQARDYDSGSGSNFAFTSLNVPVEVQMAYVRELKPDLKNLAVLVDRKNISAIQTQAEPIAKYARDYGTQVLWGAVQNPANAREELARIVADAVRTMRKNDPDLSRSLFWVTGSTSVFLEIKTINENADRVPVIAVVPEVVKAGTDTAVMSIGISFESNAHLAAVYAVQILEGKIKAGDLKVGVVSPPDIAISFLKSREIGLRVPFNFFETASFVYDYDGNPVRSVSSKVSGED